MRPTLRRRGVIPGVSVERLDHLGIVAGICQEIGLAAYLDAVAGPSQQHVSIGTATVAMILKISAAGCAVFSTTPQCLAPCGTVCHTACVAARL
jgi:Domain of unknown function (DUF4277)